jgi:hypothetical protein
MQLDPDTKMIRELLVAAILVFTCVVHAIAQDDSTQYINGIPVTEQDSVDNPPPADLFPKENHQLVPRQKLPKKLLEALTEKSQFNGWEKTGVYLDTNTGLYIVTIPLDRGRKVFGLDKKGKTVTYDEVSEKIE